MKPLLRTDPLHVAQLAELGLTAGSLLHELRQPLGGLRLSLNLALQGAPSGLERTALTDALAQIDRLEALIARGASFMAPSRKQLLSVDLKPLVERVARILIPGLERLDIQLARAIPDLPPVDANPDFVEQILFNLLQNAKDSLREARRPGRLTVAARRDGDFVTLIVADDGVGIPEAHVPQIFEPYTTTKEEHGTGLGLFVAERLATAMGGSLAVVPAHRLGELGSPPPVAALALALPVARAMTFAPRESTPGAPQLLVCAQSQRQRRELAHQLRELGATCDLRPLNDLSTGDGADVRVLRAATADEVPPFPEPAGCPAVVALEQFEDQGAARLLQDGYYAVVPFVGDRLPSRLWLQSRVLSAFVDCVFDRLERELFERAAATGSGAETPVRGAPSTFVSSCAVDCLGGDWLTALAQAALGAAGVRDRSASAPDGSAPADLLLVANAPGESVAGLLARTADVPASRAPIAPHAAAGGEGPRIALLAASLTLEDWQAIVRHPIADVLRYDPPVGVHCQVALWALHGRVLARRRIRAFLAAAGVAEPYEPSRTLAFATAARFRDAVLSLAGEHPGAEP